MADGYGRVSGTHGVCMAQNGPGIANFVTAVAADYWAHSPVVVITPESGSMTMGLGGFQEADQLPIFTTDRSYVGPRGLPSGGFLNQRRRPEDEPRDPWNAR